MIPKYNCYLVLDMFTYSLANFRNEILWVTISWEYSCDYCCCCQLWLENVDILGWYLQEVSPFLKGDSAKFLIDLGILRMDRSWMQKSRCSKK